MRRYVCKHSIHSDTYVCRPKDVYPPDMKIDAFFISAEGEREERRGIYLKLYYL